MAALHRSLLNSNEYFNAYSGLWLCTKGCICNSYSQRNYLQYKYEHRIYYTANIVYKWQQRCCGTPVNYSINGLPCNALVTWSITPQPVLPISVVLHVQRLLCLRLVMGKFVNHGGFKPLRRFRCYLNPRYSSR